MSLVRRQVLVVVAVAVDQGRGGAIAGAWFMKGLCCLTRPPRFFVTSLQATQGRAVSDVKPVDLERKPCISQKHLL